LHGNGDTSDMINIGPSHEFHGGQCLLFLGWYCTSTLEGRNINLKNCSLGYETCRLFVVFSLYDVNLDSLRACLKSIKQPVV
jgi:hypothetical protein